MGYNIKYNGFDLNTIITIQEVKRSVMANREVKIIEVANRDGGYLQHVRHQPKVTLVKFAVMGGNNTEIRNNVRLLSGILSPKKAVPVVFGDEPHLTYQGLMYGNTDYDQMAFIGKGEISLLFPDPCGYEEGKPATVTPSKTLMFQNDGSTTVHPIVKVTFNEPSTFFALVNPNDDVVLIGTPDQPMTTKVNPEERVLWSEFDNISDWQAGTFTQINGTPQGTMISNGTQFVVGSWGTGTPNGWYGPTMKKSLPAPISDFRVDLFIRAIHQITTVGRIELYLLDINNEVVGKIAMKDMSYAYKKGHAEMLAGDVSTSFESIVEYGSQSWSDFNNGLLQITRVGKTWTGFVSLFDSNGNGHTRFRGETYWAGDPQKQVAQVLVHIGRQKTHEPHQMGFHDVKVFKYNAVPTDQIPEIFQAGDVLEVDFQYGVIRKNGNIWMDYLDAGSKFFGIEGGTTEVAYMSSNTSAITVEATYQQRWL